VFQSDLVVIERNREVRKKLYSNLVAEGNYSKYDHPRSLIGSPRIRLQSMSSI